MGDNPRQGHDSSATADAAPIAAIILAAGRSTRMAPANKLTTTYKGMPMVRHAAAAAQASKADQIIVVTGHAADDVTRALAGLDVQIIYNPAFADGLSTTVRAGIDAVSDDMAGAMILLGDMPEVTATVLDRLIEAFSVAGGDKIIQPRHAGAPGNPVLWPRHLFPEFDQLTGDVGAKMLLARHSDAVIGVDVGTTAIHMDIDGLADLPQDE